MSKLPISAFLITCNEAHRLERTITALKEIVHEIILVDSGSTDATVALAKKLGCCVFEKSWQGYGAQKRFAEDQCSQDWLLNVDADEVAREKLIDQIKSLHNAGAFSDPLETHAYEIDVVLQPRFGVSDFPWLPKTTCIRLYHKKHGRFRDHPIFDSVVMKEGAHIEKLTGTLRHHSFDSYEHSLAKINDYSTAQAQDMFERGRCPSLLRLMFEPFFAFLKAYVVKRFCFLGASGFSESMLYAFSRWLRLLKARAKFKSR